MAEKAYIERSEVLNVVRRSDSLESAYIKLARLKYADVRSVVLCRDCKHKGWVQEPEYGKSVDYCHLIERCVDKRFFCAAGERKANCGADMREANDEKA